MSLLDGEDLGRELCAYRYGFVMRALSYSAEEEEDQLLHEVKMTLSESYMTDHLVQQQISKTHLKECV